MLDRQIQYFDNPFRYAIIDNFFSKEDLEFVSENIDKVEQDKNFKDMNKLNCKNISKLSNNVNLKSLLKNIL